MAQFNLTSPLILAANPTMPLQAATKQYVDALVSSIDASRFTSGVLPIERLPAFSGDLTSSAGTNVLLLANSGTMSGTYTKVNVNSKGLVIDGSQLTASDIEGVSWSKVTTGKPTTLTGYGITDVVAKNGGIVTGALAVTSAPTTDSHIATKGYVDNAFGNVTPVALSPGDLVRKPRLSAPGFFRCNGSELNIDQYPALHAAMFSGSADGRTVYVDYTSAMAVGAGKPWQQQHDFNDSSATDITGWQTAPGLPVTLVYSQAIVTKSRVYLLGGYGNSSASSTVLTAPINADGALGTWATASALPATVYHSQAIVTKNRVYLLGGYINDVPSNIVYTAPINADGTLGTWATASALPATVSHSQAIVTKNRVYLLGGYINSGSSAAVLAAWINPDGTLAPWTMETSLPAALHFSQAIVTKNRVYLLGGATSRTVYTAPINADGTLGTWTTSFDLPSDCVYAQAIVTKNRIYLLGGHSGGYSAIVYTALINTDGTLGALTAATPLPATTAFSHAIVTKNRAYLLGGVVNSTAGNTVHVATLSGGVNDYSYFYDGSVNKFDGSSVTGAIVVETYAAENFLTPGAGRPWEQQYMLSVDQSAALTGTVNSAGFPVAISGTQAVVTKNKVYLLVGKIGTADTDTIYTANINTDGSLSAWTDNAIYVNSSFSGSGSTTIPGDAKQIAVTASGSTGYSYGGELISPPIPATPGQGSPNFPDGLPPYDPRIFQGYAGFPDGLPPYWPGTPYVPPTYAPSGYVSGTASTFTVAGTTLTFPADTGSSTKYVTIPASASAYPATYSITTGSAAVKYTNYTASLPSGAVLPAKVSNHNVAVTRNRVFLIGGNKETAVTTTVFTATIDANGAISAWTAAGTLPGGANSDYSAVSVTRNRIYVLGGKTVSGGTPVASVYSAPINPDGTLGAWSASTNLPNTIYGGACFTTHNRIYLLAGYETGAISTKVYTAAIRTDGTLGTWSTAASLPTHAAYGKIYVTSKAVYVFGSNNTTTSYYADIDSNGTVSAWKSGTATGYAPVNSAIFAVKGKLYTVGGAADAGTSRNVFSCTIPTTASDYSSYYNGTIMPAPMTTFRLPDYALQESAGLYYFVKF